MKYKSTCSYPLAIALGALTFSAVSSRAQDEAPVQIQAEGNDAEEVLEQAELPGKVSDDKLDKARQDLEDAIAAAEKAEGKAKRKADDAVIRAEARLKKMMARAEDKVEGRTGAERKEGISKDDEADDLKTRPATEGKSKRDEPVERDLTKETTNSDDSDVREKRREVPPAEPTPPPITEKEVKEPDLERAAKVDSEPKVDETVAKQADIAVEKSTREVEGRAEASKLDLKDKDKARDMIRDLIGRESEVSKAEAERENRLQPNLRRDPTRARNKGKREDLREASAYLLSQLEGKAEPGQAPAFFRRPAGYNGIRRDGENLGRDDGRGRPHHIHTPRYLYEGRRYVPYESRASIPAILLAAAVLDRVEVQSTQRVERIFVNGDPNIQYANELPPESYRGEDAVVVSYPVSKSSMISSNDIIFAQGSTRFADAHSYDMVLALADAMADPKLSDAKFVIEGHASAEGSYDENMRLSQRRAESIVRDMVREGIDPERLIPVGYGESEARYGADAADALRSLDRNVMVFRIGDGS